MYSRLLEEGIVKGISVFVLYKHFLYSNCNPTAATRVDQTRHFGEIYDSCSVKTTLV